MAHRDEPVGHLYIWRRGWDSNPRTREGHTLSKRADSAALAPLQIVLCLSFVNLSTSEGGGDQTICGTQPMPMKAATFRS